MGCDTFGRKHIWSPDIWSPTIGPQLIGPTGQTVPNQFCPHAQIDPKNLVPMDKWSPTNLVPLDKWSLKYSVLFCLSRGTGCDDLEIWGPNWLGTICPWGPNWLETVCPGGPNWLGTICPRGPDFWRPFVHGNSKWGTRSPGIKWVRDQMSRSLTLRFLI